MNNISHYFIRYGIGIFFCFCFCFSFSFSLPAQEIIDSAQYRAVYNFSYKTDSEQMEFAKTDLMYLDIGQKATKFYSRYEQIRDSVKVAGLSSNLEAFNVNEQMRGYKRGMPRIYYHLMSKHKYVVTDRFAFYFALYEEQDEMPKWILSDVTKEFEGFVCQKATTNYLGRDWTVYFTRDIPVNQGPWMLWGLGGLIVKATDKDGLFDFELRGFESLNTDTPIKFVYTNYDNKEYNKESKTTFRKMEKLYYTDISEFMKLYLGASNITVTRADGTQRVGKLSTPYIPLEPW